VEVCFASQMRRNLEEERSVCGLSSPMEIRRVFSRRGLTVLSRLSLAESDVLHRTDRTHARHVRCDVDQRMVHVY
jgi:hypothetical protein